MDYSRIETAVRMASEGIKENKDKKAKVIATKVLDAAFDEKEPMDIKALMLGMFMALFAMMDAAQHLKNMKDNDPQMRKRKRKEDDTILH